MSLLNRVFQMLKSYFPVIFIYLFFLTSFIEVISQQPKTIIIKEATVKKNTETENKNTKPKPKPAPTPKKTEPMQNKKPFTQQSKPQPQPAKTETKPTSSPITKPEEAPSLVVPEAVTKPDPHDTIIKMGGKKIPVLKVKIGSNEILFTTLDGQSQQLRRKDVEKILYKNGRIEIFNKPVFQMVSESSWQAIYVTDIAAEVEGMFEIDKIKASSSSNQRSMRDAKKSATIRLQKKAAKMGAIAVLVTKRETKGGYGEVPGYEIEGIAFASEPVAKPNK